MFAVVLAAGAPPTLEWSSGGRPRLRRALLSGALALTVTGSVLITLPVVPLGDLHRTPIVSVNYDTGETVGWPTYVKELAAVYRAPPVGQRMTAILTSNYGEAGAVDRYGSALGLPHAYSGQTGYWYWGPPAPATVTVMAVGFARAVLDRGVAEVKSAGRLLNIAEG